MDKEILIRLSNEQRKFAELLEQVPRITEFWDFEKRECKLEDIRNALGVLSTGEAHMLRFFASIWLSSDEFEFNLFSAMKDLDVKSRSIISAWVANPFWP